MKAHFPITNDKKCSTAYMGDNSFWARVMTLVDTKQLLPLVTLETQVPGASSRALSWKPHHFLKE